MNLLSRRDHSEKELFQKLRAKKFPIDEIQTVLTQLLQENLLNPTRFVENYIYHRQAKGLGPLSIRMELLERGIPEEIISMHLNTKDEIWLTCIQNVWHKRFKGLQPKDFKQRAQQMRFLQSRGFTSEQIKTVCREEE